MPVHDAVALHKVNFYQAAAARPSSTRPGIGLVQGTVRSAHQPAPCDVKKMVQLVIHLHRDMAAAIQVGVHPALEADGKGAAGLAQVDHVERHRQPAVQQVG